MPSNIIVCITLVMLLLGPTSKTYMSIAQQYLQDSDATVPLVKSAEIRKYFNETADPCEDFYEFTCGNFATYHPTAKSKDIFDILDEAMMHKIEKELTFNDPKDTDVDHKVKKFYRSCMKVSRLLDLYLGKLKDVIKEFGQMPALEGETWQKGNFNWQSTLAKMIYKTGLKIIFNIGVQTDLYDKTVNRVSFRQPTFGLRDISLYMDESLAILRENYKRNIFVDLAVLLEVPQELSERTAQEILDFETSLAHGMRDKKQGVPLPKVYTLKSIEELQKKYLPIWDTKKLIGEAMGFVPNEVVVQSSYLDHTFEVMRNASPKMVANFIFYNYVSKFVIDWDFTINKTETFCIGKTKKMLYKPLMNLMYRKYFTEQMKEGVVFMWHKMKSSFEKTLLSSPRLQWMKANTRKYALQKLKAMQLQVLSFEHTNFSKIYDKVNLNSRDYVHNMNELLTFAGKKSRESFNKPPEPFVFPKVSPYDVVTENTVKIPIDVLQPFYTWSSSYPYAYNFAAIGFFVAHEIIHNFDNIGRSFGINGNALDWWDSESNKEFLKHSKCFVDQYKSYSYGGRHLPEMQSQGENIADNGGLRLAYDAYLSWYEKQKDEKDIAESETFPDLDYNNRQLFFISYSHVYCASVHPDYMRALAASDTHVPEKFRVIGPLSNFEEFSKEFNCSLGSGMNRMEKCEMY